METLYFAKYEVTRIHHKTGKTLKYYRCIGSMFTPVTLEEAQTQVEEFEKLNPNVNNKIITSYEQLIK